MVATQEPLVSIGVPVRNGAVYLAETLELLVNQTYRNIEIVISDNGSIDGTADIIQRFANNDARIKYFHQSSPLTALGNFQFVFERSSGEFFMWAAHDDRRSIDYVEQLLRTMQASSDATLVFGSVCEFADMKNWQKAPPIPYFFESNTEDTVDLKLIRYTKLSCLHIYGLIRSSALRSYIWLDIDIGPDIPLLVHLAVMGEFAKSKGGRFYYYRPIQIKTREERAIANNLHALQRFPELRLAWACAASAAHAGHLSGRPISKVRAFGLIYWNRQWGWIKPWLFDRTPAFVIEVYRKLRARP